MTRPVRASSSLDAEVGTQLEPERSQLFWRHDLSAALALLARDGVWETLPEHGVGRRLSVEGVTVGAFHLFVAPDGLDPRPDALVVYAVDIWPDGFPA